MSQVLSLQGLGGPCLALSRVDAPTPSKARERPCWVCMGVEQGDREALKASTHAAPRVASLLGVHWGWGLGGPIHLPSLAEASAPHLSLVATVPLRGLSRGSRRGDGAGCGASV